MANNYYDATGVLVLDRVTPVINALFGAFKLDASLAGDGKAFIARISGANDPQWDDVLEGLADLAATNDLDLPDAVDGSPMAGILHLLATHFDADDDEELENLIDHHSFGGSADLQALFLIATRFDDGHNLQEIHFEGCWRCSEPRLFEFSGDGQYLSREFELFIASGLALQLGPSVRQALLNNKLGKAAAVIAQETRRLLAGISGDARRTELQRQVAALLQDTAR